MFFKLKKETVKNVLSLALPAVGEMILYMMIWVFDTMMVGQYGGNVAVSTVGLSSEIMYTFSGIFISVGISVAVTSLVARNIGAKKLQNAEEYAALGITAVTIISFIISSILFIFSKNILKIAGASTEVTIYGEIYMKITSIGIFFNMITNVFSAILRGYGNTKTPLLISLVVNVINLSLDYILIFGKSGFPELGIKGAAIATTLAQITGFVIFLSYILKKSQIKPKIKYIYNFKVDKFIALLRLSAPSSLQEASFSISRLLSTFFIMHLGTIAFAANQITTTIESISFMPGWGFAVAATTLVGHKTGEENPKKAKEYAYTCTILGVGIMTLCSVLFILLPNSLINFFIKSSETEVIRLGTLCLMVASIEQPFMAISMILGGSLKGAGDTKTPFKVSFVSSWFIRLPLILYFIYILKVSVVYVWFITAIQWIFDGTLILVLFTRKFKKFNIEEKEERLA
ncbi:MATE family efflux transporter [Clostridium sp. SYSU_GA19001]|uniref:MATE family efflux transporter n=1 Tax=Clostridium caldaquaticum TaxID=2940653 RepID=UPI0020777F3A|nr:MATE family efflux transporter [Clostridium caldaquaticum]MCM8709463.1 MATE family efflux transporter [Clostridium caldaquaticum]